jgi:hypothetical protein
MKYGRACLTFSIPGSPAIPPHHTDPCIEEDMAARAEEIGEMDSGDVKVVFFV